MSFLTIPSQEGLFTTIKSGRSTHEGESGSLSDNVDNNDEDEEDEEAENVRLIPRCSPVPRKRGASIHDETAEYMRIHQALSAGKRVSFADTTGGDLVDVKEFIAFDSDEEEDSAKWEEEEAKYRKPGLEPTYRVHPEFHAPSISELLQAVQRNKVEVEQMSPVEGEPLAVSGIIRVLNVSFHKAIYIRSTMDNWVSYFDHPGEYVQGSHDGSTDQFSFKLSFAPPYTTHGSRIEFVVRYETSEGDFWANNSSMNYGVTLLLSYEEDSVEAVKEIEHVKGILKPPRPYSMDDVFDTDDELEKEKEQEAETPKSELVKPAAVCPVVVRPEIDVEIHPSNPPVPPNHEHPSADDTPSALDVSPGEHFPCTSSETVRQTNSSFVLCASESVQPNKSQPLPRLLCELGEQTSEQHSSLWPFLHESGQQSDSGEEIPPSEASCEKPPTAETYQRRQTEEDGLTDSTEHCLYLEPSAQVVSNNEGAVAEGLSELVVGLSEGSSRSALHHEDSTPAPLSPVAESQASLGAEGEAPPPPELAENPSVSAGVTEVSQNSAPQRVSTEEERRDAAQISPDTLLEDPPNTLSEVSELQTERDVNRNLMQSIVFMSGVVCLLIVLQEPAALLLIGLFLVLHRL